MNPSYRPGSWTLVLSVLLHAALIAFLLTMHSPEPIRLRSVPVALVAPSHFDLAPVAPRRFPRHSIRPSPRVFHIPENLPPPVPVRPTLLVPESPLVFTTDIPQPASVPTPTPAAPELPSARAVRAAGFSTAETSGNVPARRPLAGTGVFDAVAAGPDKTGPGKIASGSFGDASVAVAASRAKTASNTANFSAAEILSKPRPVYTEEARALRIEGEVLLEVMFEASGKARVIRTIQGLGHGLDENAIAAACAMRFLPATRGNASVDSTAVVHIVFQLAY